MRTPPAVAVRAGAAVAVRAGAAVVAVVTALAVAACTGGGDPAPRASRSPSPAGTVVVWAGPDRADAVRAFGERYRRRTGVSVQVRTIDGDLQKAFLAASGATARSGDVPDVVLGSHDWIAALTAADAIDPVPLSAAERSGLNDLALRAVTRDGQLYGVPYAIENLVLYRNAELVPDPPRTFEEAVSVGRQLQEAGRVREGMAWPVGDAGDAESTFPMYTSAGGYLFGTKSNGDQDLTDNGLAEPEAVTAFQKIALFGEGGSGVLRRSMTVDGALTTFVTSGAAYLVAGPGALPAIRRASLTVEISPVPSFFGAEPARELIRVPAFFLASRGANRDLARRFVVDSLTAPDLPSELYAAVPSPPALTAALEKVREDDPDAQRMLDCGRGGVLLPVVPRLSAIFDPIARAEAAVVSGSSDVPAVVASAAAEIDAAVG